MRPWTLKQGGQAMFTMPKVAVLRSFVMNHMIHHRAQLGVYLRMNGVPVPGLYGPSADESSGSVQPPGHEPRRHDRSSVMERKKASDYPQELLDLFHEYHTATSRGAVLRSRRQVRGRRPDGRRDLRIPAAQLRVGAAGAERRRADQDEYETVQSPEGNGTIKGYLARPAKPAGKLPAVLVIHENRGLNPYIEDVARRLALGELHRVRARRTDVGRRLSRRRRKRRGRVPAGGRTKMTEDFVAAANWLKAHPDCTGKLGAVGFCFGGGIANTLAVRLPDLVPASPSTARSRCR